MNTHKFTNIAFRFVMIVIGGLLLLILLSNAIIIVSGYNRLYDNVNEIPESYTAIVLGTSRQLKSGAPNPFFHYRISAAAELYHAGKVQYLIVSGDNRTQYYNEPEQMRRHLVKYHVPDTVIYSDYAGLRTLDSMVRSKKIFGQDSIIVVSQKFHNQRAIFLARLNGVHAIGFNASDVSARQGVRVLFREAFARVKVFVDILTGKKPRHLGDEVQIGHKDSN